MLKIYPSIISARLLNLEEDIKILEPYCDGFHLDIMDFHFVANLTMGPQFINKISQLSAKQLFVHLMVDNPIAWLDLLKLKTNDIFSFHYESTEHLEELIQAIHNKNWLASIAINPKTPVYQIFQFTKKIDQVLLMSVEPGFSGQKFISETINKLKELHQYKQENNLNFSIAIDGGINETNIQELVKNGADSFAISTGIFSKENPINALENLYKLCK